MSKILYTKEELLAQCGEKLTLNDIQHRLVEMTASFDEFCTEHNIRYYPGGGTLIGAIRHGGFIPWDDDVDFFLPREDYERLLKFSSISEDIDIVSYKNPNGYYHPFQHANLADKKTMMISNSLKNQTGKGQFIDLFPLDNVPDNEKEMEKFYAKLYGLCRKKSWSQNALKKPTTIRKFGFDVLSIMFHYCDVDKLVKKIDRIAQSYNEVDCLRWGICSSHPFKQHTWKKSDFDNILRRKFDFTEISVPEGYDSILSHTFGNYMKLPPKEQQIGHHDVDVYWRNDLSET